MSPRSWAPSECNVNWMWFGDVYENFWLEEKRSSAGVYCTWSITPLISWVQSIYDPRNIISPMKTMKTCQLAISTDTNICFAGNHVVLTHCVGGLTGCGAGKGTFCALIWQKNRPPVELGNVRNAVWKTKRKKTNQVDWAHLVETNLVTPEIFTLLFLQFPLRIFCYTSTNISILLTHN